MDFTFLPGLSDELFALDSHMLAVPPNSYDDEAHLAYIAELLDLDENGSRLDEQTTRWLQMPLIPRKYDTDMLNALLRVFLRHVSGTFLSFQDFSITSSTLPEQILSMASVGSLFVDFKGSSRVARMLFTDCNRMLNNFVSILGNHTLQSLITPALAGRRHQVSSFIRHKPCSISRDLLIWEMVMKNI